MEIHEGGVVRTGKSKCQAPRAGVCLRISWQPLWLKQCKLSNAEVSQSEREFGGPSEDVGFYSGE